MHYCTATALRCSRSHSQRLGSLCCEMRVAPWEACFALGRRVQRCLGRVTRRRRVKARFDYRAGTCSNKHAYTRPRLAFWGARRAIPALKRPETESWQSNVVLPGLRD